MRLQGGTLGPGWQWQDDAAACIAIWAVSALVRNTHHPPSSAAPGCRCTRAPHRRASLQPARAAPHHGDQKGSRSACRHAFAGTRQWRSGGQWRRDRRRRQRRRPHRASWSAAPRRAGAAAARPAWRGLRPRTAAGAQPAAPHPGGAAPAGRPRVGRGGACPCARPCKAAAMSMGDARDSQHSCFRRFLPCFMMSRQCHSRHRSAATPHPPPAPPPPPLLWCRPRRRRRRRPSRRTASAWWRSSTWPSMRPRCGRGIEEQVWDKGQAGPMGGCAALALVGRCQACHGCWVRGRRSEAAPVLAWQQQQQQHFAGAAAAARPHFR